MNNIVVCPSSEGNESTLGAGNFQSLQFKFHSNVHVQHRGCKEGLDELIQKGYASKRSLNPNYNTHHVVSLVSPL